MVIFRENRGHLRRHRVRGRRRQAKKPDRSCRTRWRPRRSASRDQRHGRARLAEGTERLVRKAIQYAIDNDKPSVTLVHKGNIMKFTEGAFRDWGYQLAQKGVRRRADRRWPVVRSKNPKTGVITKDDDRRRLPAADHPAPRRVFPGDRDAQPGTATTSPTRWLRRSAASASRRAPTCRTASPSRGHCTVRRPSTPAGLREPWPLHPFCRDDAAIWAGFDRGGWSCCSPAWAAPSRSKSVT